MTVSQTDLDTLQSIRQTCNQRFETSLTQAFAEDFEPIIPKHVSDLHDGLVYFPTNPLAGVFQIMFTNNTPHMTGWLISRNHTGNSLFNTINPLVITDESGNITESKIAYVPEHIATGKFWQKWEYFEFTTRHDFQPKDGFMWYCNDHNIDLFPEIQGYPKNWYDIAKASYKPYTDFINHLDQQLNR